MLRDLTQVTASLDQTVSGDSDTTLGELRTDEAPAPEDEVVENHRERAVTSALDQLTELERKVVELRFGTGGNVETSVRGTARTLGIKEEHARELEVKALKQLAGNGTLDAWRDAA